MVPSIPLAALDRKLVRDLLRMRGQLAAIAMVMAVGVTVFVMFTGMMRSLEVTRAAFYERTRFGDVYATVKRAPEHVAARIAAIDGVAAVATRIRSSAILAVPGFDEPVTAAVQSVPDHGRPPLNDLVLRQGRWVDQRRADEVLISEAFAEAHDLVPGDRLSATLHGVRQRLTVVGVVLSPDYVYAIAPGRIVPDDRRFGIVWMARRQLEAAYDMDGAFNELVVTLLRGTRPAAVIDAVDRTLDRYGGTGAYARADHPSDQFLDAEIDQLRTIVRILPPIFLAVSAFLVNVVIARLVALERGTIGLLKAFGYANRVVAGHYLKLVGLIVAVAIALGFGLGTWLGRLLAELYVAFFRFPVLYFEAGAGAYWMAALVAAGAGTVGAVGAVRRAAALTPAEAMRPPSPLDYSQAGGRALARWRAVDGITRMVLRHLLRHPGRTGLTVLGIALAGGLLAATRANLDSTQAMIEVTFEQAEVQDATVTFTDPIAADVLYDLAHLPGVRRAEPFRVAPAILTAGRAEKRQALVGVRPGTALNRLIAADGSIVSPPEDGVLLSRSLGDSLGLARGDRFRAQVTDGHQPVLDLRVVGLVETYVGTPVYMNIATLNRALEEGPAISGAYLSVDAAETDALFAALKAMPRVAGVELSGAAYASFREIMDESIGVMLSINLLFASVVIFGVVYNAARISLSERQRELASMRVLGFTRGEVTAVMLGELAVMVVLALPLGTAFGALLSYFLTQSFSQDLYTIPFVWRVETAARAALIMIAAATLSGLVVWRRIARLDMIAVLKTRE
ncbi:hypothetical protein CCR85_04950 [Rhodothalassium salexigens]|uniref:ABC transporter permease n=1 Tax=Rhodothalassium salexigens TaxID=1086 RepID=UPI0019114E9B|nr:ABC transporter permease [Rhodothalassium salexigens]MBK5910840.1 hypothetical protein [Rhodothalassium salexigens]